jgi:uncharacterized protein (TIGR00369 family)
MNDHPQGADTVMPFAALLGIVWDRLDRDRVVATMAVRADLCTVPAVLHGGAAMALADTVGAMATVLNLPDGAAGTTTIESKTNFLRPAPVGTTVRAECAPIHRGRRTMVWQTTILGEDGKPVAVVTQTQMVL